MPRARDRKGFNGAYFLVNRETGKGMVLTLWESQGDMEASAQAAAQQREQAAQRTGAQRAGVDIYEVAVQY